MNFSGRFFLSFRYSTEYLGETRTRPDNNMNCIIYKNGFYLNLFLNKRNTYTVLRLIHVSYDMNKQRIYSNKWLK